jgi:flagellar biosynthetic protein FliR
MGQPVLENAASLGEHAVAVVLLIGRTGAFLAMSPVLRRLPVPRLAGTPLVVTVAILFHLAGLGPAPAGLAPSWKLVEAMAVEIAIGLLLGLLALLVFEALRLAGEFMGLSVGLGGVNLLDPTDAGQHSVTGTLYGLVAGLIFFLLDGHHAVLQVLALSYRLAPAGDAPFPAAGGPALVALGGQIFAFGLRVAAPVMAALLLTDVAMAVLARTVPQMPIFFVALPFKIGLGFVLMGLTLPATLALFAGAVDGLQRDLLAILHPR